MIEEVKSLELKSGDIARFWLGQNSYVLKTFGGTMFAVDSYLTREERYHYVHFEPPIKNHAGI